MLYGFHPYQHCKNATELINNVKKEPISIPPDNNINVNISDECISLLRMLLQKNVSRRITWKDFFTHPWINKWEYVFDTQQLKDRSSNEIVSVSLTSIQQNDYLNKFNTNNNNKNNDETKKSSQTCDENIETISYTTDDSDLCLFKIDDCDECNMISCNTTISKNKCENC